MNFSPSTLSIQEKQFGELLNMVFGDCEMINKANEVSNECPDCATKCSLISQECHKCFRKLTPSLNKSKELKCI